jgi:REP element-mobilizing transposase RayT
MNSRHSNVLVLAHVVWATKHRSPVLAVEHDGFLRTLLHDAVPEERGWLRAFGASNDHVHVLVELSASVRFCDLVQSLKGASARRWNQQPPLGASPVRWQDGYWARSVSPDEDETLVRYILNQREHHAMPQPPEPWELGDDRSRG